MTCPQCSNNLPDTATFCPRCGSTIRPVAFSYLPAGAPAWPTMVPQRPQYGTAAAISSSQQDELISATKAAARPRRSAQSMLVILALCVLTPLVSVGVTLGVLWANGQLGGTAPRTTVHVPAASQQTPVANSSPTVPSAQGTQLPTPTAFQTANSPEVGITLKYPADWVEDTPQTSADSNSFAIHPQSSKRLGINFYLQRFSSTLSSTINTTSDLNQSNITAFSSVQGVHNVQPISAVTAQRQIGGSQWDEQDASFTNDSGTLFHFTTLTVKHNKLYYNITFYSPDTYYNEAMQKYFQPMFDSFQFQK